MATRIAFSTVYPDRMGELAGKPTNFPMKILKGINPELTDLTDIWTGVKGDSDERYEAWNNMMEFAESRLLVKWNCHPKTTTIRKNYDYWKSKEGQLLQPFFWAGNPYRSRQVVFCPEVRLARVWRVKILPSERLIEFEDSSFRNGYSIIGKGQLIPLTQNEGFDHPGHFWMWFNQDFNGALLELESVER